MDIVTLKKAMKYAEDILSGATFDVEELKNDFPIATESGEITSKLIINALRQHIWQSEDEALICEEGTVTLTNSKKFPFNDSKVSVALANRQKDQKYIVIPEISTASGDAGEIEVTDKAVNGFKIAFNGGAKSVTVKYYVIGGFIV